MKATTCNSICDKHGCDVNSFYMGGQTFLCVGITVRTSPTPSSIMSRPRTTSSPDPRATSAASTSGTTGHRQANTNIPSMDASNSINYSFCRAEGTSFCNTKPFEKLGSIPITGNAFDQGMVVVASFWEDYDPNMLWPGSDYLTDTKSSQPGRSWALPCLPISGILADIRLQKSGATVILFSVEFDLIRLTYMLWNIRCLEAIPDGPLPSKTPC